MMGPSQTPWPPDRSALDTPSGRHYVDMAEASRTRIRLTERTKLASSSGSDATTSYRPTVSGAV